MNLKSFYINHTAIRWIMDSNKPLQLNNVWVKKTETNWRSDTLLWFVSFFLTQTLDARHIHICFKISNAQQCLFPHFVRFVSWTLNVKLFLIWFSRWNNTGVISGSQTGLQLLQNTEIIKQIDVIITLENLKKIQICLLSF